MRVGQPAKGSYDILINATSLGMKVEDPPPLDLQRIDGVRLVAECVVAQESTPLLRAAQALGRGTHPGLAMLEAQIELMVSFMLSASEPTAR